MAAEPSQLAPGAQALAHADALYNLARRLCDSAADAEDLVQETFARALRAWGQLGGGELRAWLLRILRNTWLDRLRRDRRHPWVPEAEEGDEAAPAGDDGWLRGDLELEQLRGLVARDIEAALRELPEPSRTAILLDLEGLTEAEVALVLGCAVGTVKSRLWRARAALRHRLAEYRR